MIGTRSAGESFLQNKETQIDTRNPPSKRLASGMHRNRWNLPSVAACDAVSAAIGGHLFAYFTSLRKMASYASIFGPSNFALASEWGDTPERKNCRSGIDDSKLLHFYLARRPVTRGSGASWADSDAMRPIYRHQKVVLKLTSISSCPD